MSAIVPTDEQNKVVELSKLHKMMKIAAYAGAAKTSTLVMVAEANIAPSLLLTFNKSLATEASDRFPVWVECRTTHSLAYQHFGRPLQHKLKRPMGAYRNVAGTGTEVAKYFKQKDYTYMLKGERESRRIKLGGVGVAIKETVARFEHSADKKITEKHVSISPCDSMMIRDDRAMATWKAYILIYARQLWELRKDITSEVMCTHDTYLKLYQLSKPDLSQYEVLYLDESQDTAAVVLDIVLQQIDRCRIYACGDEYQNIYSWRGAENAMLKLDWTQAMLTKSFRYGQAVGDLADVVLANGGNRVSTVKGWEALNTLVTHKHDLPTEVFDGQYTMLFRTNGALIMEAVRLLQQGKTVNLEIDVSDFTKLLESAIALWRGDMVKVKHESLVQFENWTECGVEAELVQGELFRVYTMVENGSVHQVLKMLGNHRNVENPDVIMTSAHKSKGREWDVVLLADDFPSVYNSKGEWVGLLDGERNLLYVALTRAKKVLGYNDTVLDMVVKDRLRMGVDLRITEMKVLSRSVGLAEVARMQEQLEDDVATLITSSEHSDELIEMALEDGMSCDDIPTKALLMPTATIVKWEPHMNAPSLGFDAQVEKRMMELGGGALNDLDRYVLGPNSNCTIDGDEIPWDN